MTTTFKHMFFGWLEAEARRWTNPDGSPFVKRLDIITSDYFRSHYKETLIPYMFEQLDIEDRFQFATCRTHKKTAILITTCGKFIYITGSANLRSSDNVEEITIITDESICLAKAAQADRIIEKFHHLNHGVPRIKKKALNSDATWEAVANLEDGSSRKSRGRKKK